MKHGRGKFWPCVQWTQDHKSSGLLYALYDLAFEIIVIIIIAAIYEGLW